MPLDPPLIALVAIKLLFLFQPRSNRGHTDVPIRLLLLKTEATLSHCPNVIKRS